MIKARHSQQQQHDVSPSREVQDTSPPPPPPPILNEDEVTNQQQRPYDPQLRYEFSPKERVEVRYEQTPQSSRPAEHGTEYHTQAQVVTPPYSLPLSIEREEIIAPKEKRHQRVVSPPPAPRFSPTYEESPPPPQEPVRSPTSPTVDYTEVPIYPNIKPSHQNVTSSPRRVPSQPNEITTNQGTTSTPVPPPILKDETFQKKPIRSLHPSITTTTTTKEITRNSAPTSNEVARHSSERDSTTPVRHSYAYTEMTPQEAQALYANMTKPESAKGDELPVQEVKTTRHRIEVTRVTHIDTTKRAPVRQAEYFDHSFSQTVILQPSHTYDNLNNDLNNNLN